jgi:hypothetical protein
MADLFVDTLELFVKLIPAAAHLCCFPLERGSVCGAVCVVHLSSSQVQRSSPLPHS